MSPKKRMALAEASTSKGIRAGHIYSRTLLRGLAAEGYLQQIYGDTFEISPKGLTWLVSHGYPTPRHAIGSSSPRRDPAGSHIYRLNIQPMRLVTDKEPHEYVELYRSSDPLAISWNGGFIAIAYRYGKELTRFIPTRPMLKRLMNEVPGKLIITKEMVERARLIASSAGR